MGNFSELVGQIKQGGNDPSKMSFKEYYSYAFAKFGQKSLDVMTGGYLLIFYMAIGLSTETAATIMAVTKIWDAINDPVVATVIDNGRNPKGKFKPYIVKFAPLAAFFSVLMFINPPVGDNVQMKIFWCAVTYAVWETFNTIYGVSVNAMQAVMSRDTVERSSYLTLGNIGERLAGAIPGVIPVGYDLIVKKGLLPEASFFTIAAIFFAIVGCAGATFGANLKERIIPPKQDHLLESFVTFAKNKPLILLWSSGISNIISKIGWNTAAFFFIHSMGSYSMQSILWIVLGVPSTIATVLTPYFVKRYRPSRILIFSNIMTALPLFIMYAVVKPVGYSSKIGIALYLGFSLLSGISFDIKTIASNICKVNTYDYSEWKTGKRAEATSMVVTGTLDKIIDAAGNLLVGYSLRRIGFVEGEGVVQSQRTKDGLFMFNALAPALGTLLSSIPYLFFKIEGKRYDEIKAALDVRLSEKAENSEDPAEI